MEHAIMNMGEIIRDMRKAKGLTQDALAQAAGVSVQAVSKWETGQSLPDVTLLPAIADFFGVATDTLFGREVPAPSDTKEEAPASLFEDDGKLRVVQYLGSRLMGAEECADGKEIRLLIDEAKSNMEKGGKLEIEIQGSARINGTVNGAMRAAGGAFISGNVNGPATAGADITCEGNVNGPASAGASIVCKNASGFDGKAINDSLSSLKDSLSGLGGMFSGMFGGRRAGGQMNAFFRGELPDDDVIRVVQMQGRRIMSVEESGRQQTIRLSVERVTDPLNVEIYGSAEIKGDVNGSATAGDSMTCGNVGGNAQAGDAMTCGSVGGSVTAGDGITCGSVTGNVRAGDSVRISGDVGGNVTASDSVTCGNISGDVKADSVKCASANSFSGKRRAPGTVSVQTASPIDVSGLPRGVLNVVQVMNGRILSAEESRMNHAITLRMDDADGSDIHIHGDAQIEGNIGGDLRAGGSVTCETVEGDVAAGGNVTCETVEGDVTAGKCISCTSIEGDVNGDLCVTGESKETSVSCGSVSGALTVRGAAVSCGDVEGSVLAEGQNETSAIDLGCGSIGGNLTVKGMSVSCGDVEGSVTAEGTSESSSVSCGDVGGSLTVKGAAASCGDVEGDVYAEGENLDASVNCGGISGNLTVHSMAVTCEDVEGYVYAAGGNPDAEVSCGSIGGSLTAKGISVTCEGVEGSVYTEDRSEDM